jgi:hypothetical protein
MAIKWKYEQWAAKYGDLQHTNKPLNGIAAGTEYFEQAKQLADTKWTLDDLDVAVRYWRGIKNNIDARANPKGSLTVDPYYDTASVPVFTDDPNQVPVDEQIVAERELQKQMDRCYELLKPHYPDIRIVASPIGKIVYYGIRRA